MRGDMEKFISPLFFVFSDKWKIYDFCVNTKRSVLMKGEYHMKMVRKIQKRNVNVEANMDWHGRHIPYSVPGQPGSTLPKRPKESTPR